MARHTTDVYLGYQREEVILDIPIPYARAGTWHGEIRSRQLDDESGDWFFEIGYRSHGQNRIGTFPVQWIRRPELTDYDGIVPPEVLEQMRREAAG